jgi:hypothetical protein
VLALFFSGKKAYKERINIKEDPDSCYVDGTVVEKFSRGYWGNTRQVIRH